MRILALDSTAKAASAAIAVDGRVVSRFVADNGLTHSELLLPMAEAVCKNVGVTFADIDLFAVTVGPGSFTGVRIGVAAVKGLAFRFPQTDEPNTVAVSTLEALAEGLAPLDGILCPVMDARRFEVYNALFRMENGVLTRLTPDRAISLSALGEELQSLYPDTPVRLAGDGYALAHRALSAYGLSLPETPPLLREQNAASVALCAHRAYLRGEAVLEHQLAPVYLRMPQAERERLERQNNQKE